MSTDQTRPLSTGAGPETAGEGNAPAEPRPWPPRPAPLAGPAPFPVVLGILGLLLAGSVLVAETTEVSLPWSDLGPWSVVVGGLVVVLVGVLGLRSNRRRG